MESRCSDVYEFGCFLLDANERRLHLNGTPVPVGTKVFDTMLVLVRHYGRLVRKRDLIREVWQEGIVDDNSIAHNVAEVRRILRTCGQGHQLETVRGHGYRLNSLDRDELAGPLLQERAPREYSRFQWQKIVPNMPADKARALFEDSRVQKCLKALLSQFETTGSLPDYKRAAATMASNGFGANVSTVYEVTIPCSGQLTMVSLRAQFAGDDGPFDLVITVSFGAGAHQSS